MRAPNGDLLTFAEGRVAGSDDFGDKDIVMKRSKDKGKTWSVSEVVAGYDKLQAGNPAPVFDLSDPAFPKGRLTEGPHKGRIYIATNHSAGAPKPKSADYQAHGFYSDDHGKTFLAFSNAADTKERDNLTLRISFDDGKTWKQSYVVDKSKNGTKDYTAYSDLVQTGKKTIGVLYESDGYKSIVFKEAVCKD